MKKLLALTATLALVGSLQAQVTTWTATNGQWNTAGNWDAGVPVSGGTAIINTSSANVTLNATPLTGLTVNQSAGAATRTGSLTLNATTWNLTGGTFTTSSGANLALSSNAVFNANGGTLNVGNNITLGTGADFNLISGSASAALLSMGFDAGNTATISGGTFTGNITAQQNTVLNISGGTVNSTTTSFSGNPGTVVNLTGGTFNAGALTLARVATGTAAEISLSNNAVLTLSSLTYSGTGSVIPTWDFSNLWTGSLSLTGATTLTDYWNALTNSGTFANVQLNNTTINQTTFNDTFQINGSNALVIPEPSTWMLLAGSLTALVIFRRRRMY